VAFTPEQKSRIIDAMDAKLGKRLVCPACRQSIWTLADGMVLLQLQDRIGNLKLGGPALPSLAPARGHTCP
jgi:hypothetical protein